MTKKILITGGTGLVGGKLTSLLLSKGYAVSHLSRSKKNEGKIETYVWDIDKNYIEEGAFEGVAAVVHLAGAGVADKKWTESRKKEILESRTKSTKLLFEKIKALENPPKAFISASAIGFYGLDTGDEIKTEASDGGDGFLADVVKKWENEVDTFNQLNMRVVKLRLGIVLAKDAGALPKMALPVKMFLGAPLGSGEQYMSWIHIDDLTAMFLSALNDSAYEGTYNAVSPSSVTNKEFTENIARSLNRFLFLPKVPAFILKLVLGEMASILLYGNRVKSSRLDEHKFSFEYINLDQALNNLL